MAKRKHRGSPSGSPSPRPFRSDPSFSGPRSERPSFGKKGGKPPRREPSRHGKPGGKFGGKSGRKPAAGWHSGHGERPTHPERGPQARVRGAGEPAENVSRPERGAARNQVWIYGLHAVKAALANPHRRHHRLLLTHETAEALHSEAVSREVVAREVIARVLPPGAVHQGAALLTQPLPDTALEDVLDRAGDAETSVIVVLDQVTDPQNVGAILRSAAAFGADAVLVPDRHAPPETGALVKAASGAVEIVPLIRVVNLARALEDLKKVGFWIAGLDGHAPQTLAGADLSGKVALVLGAEGEGLRRLTRDHCDILVRLPISDRMESLNVSAAAAVALYELARKAGHELAGKP